MLRGILSGKVNELLSDIEGDLLIFGKARDHVLRGLFNILDELFLDGYDISKYLAKLRELSASIILAKDKIRFLTRLLIAYNKIGHDDVARELLDEVLTYLQDIVDSKEKLEIYLTVIKSASMLSESNIVNKLMDDLLKYSDSLPLINKIYVLAKLGEIVSYYDAGKGDALINYGRDLIDKLDYSYEKASALIHVARSLLSVSRDKENVRVARNWLSEAFRLIESLDESEYITFIARFIGDISIISKSKAIQLISEVINLTRPNEFGFETLLLMLRSLYESKMEDLADRVRKIFLYRLDRAQSFSIDKKIIYLAKLANCDSIVDSYLAKYVGKIVFKLLSNRMSKPKSIDTALILEAIKHYSYLDLYNAHIFFTIIIKPLLRSANSPEQLSRVLDIYYEYKFIFPKIILKDSVELFNNIIIKEKSELVEFIPTILGIIISIDNNYEQYVRRAVGFLNALKEPEKKALLLAMVARNLYKRNPVWANELIDFCIEELSYLEFSEMIRMMIRVSDIIHETNKQKAKELLKSAIRILEEKPDIEDAPELIFIISRKMRTNFGDNGWARQLELLANEWRAKRDRSLRHH